MSETDFDVLRAIERDHIRTVAAETKAREDALAAHIASLQDQLRTAESYSSSHVVECTAEVGASNFKSAPSSQQLCFLTPHLEPLNIGATLSATRFEYGNPVQSIPQESSHLNMPDDDPLEVLGRLVESKLGRQVDLFALKICHILVD